MKAAFLLLLTLAGAAPAALVLVDDSTNNGSFENGTSTVPSLWTTAQAGHIVQRLDTLPDPHGNWSLVIGLNNGATPLTAALDTGYLLNPGDLFTLSFQHRGAYGADGGEAVIWSLFYTSDNTISGSRTVFDTGSTGVVKDTWVSSGSFTSDTVGGEAAGKRLFLSFTPGAGFSNDEFARVDSVSLSVIPETPVFLPAGVLLFSGCWYRRRR